ncbi:MAG: hypothetical protein JOZ83_02065 [Silvibacterium sp.]|nr:hypothetical protein [Silvibacterium sp.]
MPKRASRLNWRLSPLAMVGVICIALVLIAGIAQVAHSHPWGQPDHDCALCVSAHQVVQIVALVTLAISILRVVAVAPERTRRPPAPSFFYKLACRPPPSAPGFA